MELEKEWVLQIEKQLKNNNECSTIKEKEQWMKHCIYKIPSSITDMNKRAYVPQAASFGPYHHGKEHLIGMEEHKQRALLHFLMRRGKPLEVLFQSMAQVEKDLRDTYKPLDWKEGDHNGFLRMMIADGCFMLEVLRSAAHCVSGDYADNDPVFSDHGRLYIIPFIKRDMLLLENQLPMMVLEKLVEFEGNKLTQDEELLNKLIVEFFFPGKSPAKKIGKSLHLLDVYRKSLLQHEPSHRTILLLPSNSDKIRGSDEVMRSARELLEAGVVLRPSHTHSLKDVSFNYGVLRLPPITVDDNTESIFLNLIAFERFHVGAGNDVTSYIFFMDSIIDHDIDVAILHHRGIVVNAFGSDKAVAKLFNSLSRDVAVDRRGALDKVQVSVCRYCRKPWNKWRADLIQKYFRSPWAVVSLIAGFFIFALTTMQTVFTVSQFYQANTYSHMPMQFSRLPPPHP